MAEREEAGQVGTSDQAASERGGWHRYEEEKQALHQRVLSPREYEQQVRALAERMGL